MMDRRASSGSAGDPLGALQSLDSSVDELAARQALEHLVDVDQVDTGDRQRATEVVAACPAPARAARRAG